jgi:predicted unusual protein kinase regulating ubiquinone biosynthesis (AarF/ABC1/UbiB family)
MLSRLLTMVRSPRQALAAALWLTGSSSPTCSKSLRMAFSGMVGRISPVVRDGLREAAIAMVTQDAARLVRSFQALDLLLPGADLALIEQAQARFFALFGGKNMAELRQISHQQIEQFADDFRELLYDMPFQVPTNLLLLGRTLGILSGMCSGLDPTFDLWGDLEPFVQKLVAAEAGSGAQQLVSEVGKIASALVALPVKASRILDRIERDGLGVRAPDLARQLARMEQDLHQLAAGVIFAALLLGGVQLELGGSHVFAIALLAGAALTLIWFVLSRRH